MSYTLMKYDSEDDWPLLFPDYAKRAKRCSKCCHPSTHHAIDVARGLGTTIYGCVDCRCMASIDDFEDDGPVRGVPYAKG